MAQMIELNLTPDTRILRQFGWISLVGFGLLAALSYFELLIFSGEAMVNAKPTVMAVLLGLAGYCTFFSLVWPKANLPVYVGLTILAYPIGFVLSHVIMGALFFLIITPVGLVLRMLGNDPLHRAYEPDAESYWIDSHPERPKESYFKQY
jgi:hypothetical protein